MYVNIVFIYCVFCLSPTPLKSAISPMAKDSSSSSSSTFNSTSEAMSRFHGSVRKAFTGYYRTRDFIRRVRACKTASDERTLVAKESAAIRDSFKAAAVGREQKYHSLAKLVYIYLLGYPSIFGQVECMKLAASVQNAANEPAARFKDKRLGYLGVTLLSDEHQETLTLVTNSLKFDLNNRDNESIQALALTSLTLLASTGMARELATEVETLLTAPTANIRKKAVACATKLVQKDPELIEIFEPRLTALLSDKNHAVQLTALELFQTILEHEDSDSDSDSGSNSLHLKLLPSLVKMLQSLQTAPLDTEYDISGVSDPLLQISLLRTIRQLAQKQQHPISLDSLNDLLAQLATTLDTSKNVGNAVLYEVVLTVMALPQVDQSLVNLAIGTLGRFLTGNSCGDNNLRYVALNLLTKILNTSTRSILAQIQKHQATILACLHDADSTIRKKAADLALLLIHNSADLAQIAPALLDLCRRDRDHDQEILIKLTRAIQKYARDPIVFLNLYISLLKQVDSLHPAKNEIVLQFIRHASKLSPVQVVRELYFALTIIENSEREREPVDDSVTSDLDIAAFSSSSLVEKPKIVLPSDALLESAFWFFGEFGQIVPLESLCSASDLISLLAAFTFMNTTAAGAGDSATASYALNALAKLSVRIPDHLDAIKSALSDAQSFYRKRSQFDLFDRTSELLRLISSEKMRKMAFKQEALFAESELCESSEVSEVNEIDSLSVKDESTETSNTITATPRLVLGHLNVFVDQSQVTSPSSLQLQLYFTSTSALSKVSIALAVPRGFDFDYLAPASSSTINPSDPLDDRISLSIVLRKNKKAESVDLLDLSDEPEDNIAAVDWNSACTLKIKVNYTCDNERQLQHIGALPNLLQ